jgi:ribonucleoside-diphosphate reductase alpha chain
MDAAGRPEILHGRTYQVESPFGIVFVTLNEDSEGHPFELFLKIGKCGSDVAADAEAIARLCSLLLRLPSPVSEQQRIRFVIKHLKEIGGSHRHDSHAVRSVPDAIARALSQYLDGRSG